MTNPRTFRFGAQLTTPFDGLSWGETARRVETLGFSSLLMPDHFGDQWGVLASLGAAAEATTDLKLGALVFGNDYRHPVILAKEVATIDQISKGRAEFGIGAGWMRSDYVEAGLDYDAPGTRISRMIESVEIIQAIFGDGAVTYDGAYYQLTAYDGLPKPYLPSGPPLLIGGGGERMLRTAARYADIVGVTANLRAGEVGPDAIADSLAAAYDKKLGWIRDEAGERFDEIEFSSLTMSATVTEDLAASAEYFAQLFQTTPELILESPAVLLGSIEQICERLELRRDRWGFSYICIQGTDVESMAPVVARLAGT